MEIGFTLEGGEELRARLQQMQDATENLEPALLRSGLVVLRAAMDRIDQQGPGWEPNQTGTPLLHVTGRLLSSLTVGGADNDMEVVGDSITVGTNVEYARWLQEGTGIFGERGEPIRPVNAKALYFGGHFYASVKGMPPRPYLIVDEQVAQTVQDVFARYITGQPFTETNS